QWWLSTSQVIQFAQPMLKNDYGQYLNKIICDDCSSS
ncbi:glucose-1-phosphate thymidylyltransferase, partial [Vibrio parahaemolyticus]